MYSSIQFYSFANINSQYLLNNLIQNIILDFQKQFAMIKQSVMQMFTWFRQMCSSEEWQSNRASETYRRA